MLIKHNFSTEITSEVVNIHINIYSICRRHFFFKVFFLNKIRCSTSFDIPTISVKHVFNMSSLKNNLLTKPPVSTEFGLRTLRTTL